MRAAYAALVIIALFVVADLGLGQERKTRDQLVYEDLETIIQDGFWIYNDFDQAQRKAQATGQPLLVVLRCIPCEACAQLDRDVMERDPLIQSLMSQYVCLRIVHANGLDLNLFQYDYDQSFAVFLMNADKTIYGRFGTRSHQTESDDDVSLEGFAKALQAGLEIHHDYPQNNSMLAGKQPASPAPFPRPELFPRLREKFGSNLNYEENVARSCIHCHQVGEALREYPRDSGEAISESVLFPYPHPKALGLIMDPREMSTVQQVVAGSPAEAAGFLVDDTIQEIAGQQPISIADLQWVLHMAPSHGTIPIRVHRGDESIDLELELKDGWRRLDTISWRATSWSLRRMVTGGLVLEELDEQQRSQANLKSQQMALIITHVGQYGDHALAKKSGFEQGDVVISVDGRDDLQRESDVFAHLIDTKQAGDEVQFVVMRDGERRELVLKMQQ